MPTEVQPGRPWLILARRVARGLSVLSAAMVLLFLFGGLPANHVEVSLVEKLQMTAFFTVVISLLVAWRWEWQGALASLLALGTFYGLELAVKGRFPGGVFPVFAIPAVLYLLCSTLDGRSRSPGPIDRQLDPTSPHHDALSPVDRIDQPSFQS